MVSSPAYPAMSNRVGGSVPAKVAEDPCNHGYTPANASGQFAAATILSRCDLNR
jgi:hypothetical protein